MSQDTFRCYTLFFRHISPEALLITDLTTYFAITTIFWYPRLIQNNVETERNMGYYIHLQHTFSFRDTYVQRHFLQSIRLFITPRDYT